MLAEIFVYGLFAFVCIAGLIRPWVGLVGFFGFVLLEPDWNWRWVIPDDFGFQKYIAVSVVVGFVLAGLQMRELSRATRYALSGFVMFLALAYLSTTQSMAPDLSDFYMTSIWKIVVMAVLAVVLLDEPEKIWWFVLVLIVAQGYSAFRINEQYFQDGFCAYARGGWGSKGDNNLYSNLTVPLLACSVSICVFAKSSWGKFVAGAIFILQMHQIMLLESRGAMIASLVTLVIFALYMPKTVFAVRAAVVFAVAGVVLAGPPVVKEFSSSFAKKGERDTSADSRFKLWKAGFDITADFPLLGVGPYAGQVLVPSYYEGGLETQRKGLHNLFFEISTGTGVPATICYFSFFFVPLYVSWRHVRVAKETDVGYQINACWLAVTAGIPGYLCASMFSSGALNESSYALAAVGLAADSIYRVQAKESS